MFFAMPPDQADRRAPQYFSLLVDMNLVLWWPVLTYATAYHAAAALDPNFGLGYQGLAIMSRNLGRLQDSQKYSLEALNHLQGMTGRERLAVRASYYLSTGDFQQCEKGYGELIAQYAADAVAHSNRAGCLSKLRNMREAVEGGRRAAQILPKGATLRANLAMLASYAGEFQTDPEDWQRETFYAPGAPRAAWVGLRYRF